MSDSPSSSSSVFANFTSGAIAGITTDVALFPLDTIKTRLQSAQGFWKSGGFKSIYQGLGPTTIGSAPGAALFFVTYEYMKKTLNSTNNKQFNNISLSVKHMIAAGCGEFMACLVRVPTENMKQNMQTSNDTIKETFNKIKLKNNGSYLGFYNGFNATLLREIPFSFIQFPLYEIMKANYGSKDNSLLLALYGSLSGMFAAALTTPLDVIKTRLMIGEDHLGKPYKNFIDTAYRIYTQEQFKIFFSGLTPRVTWIGIGGFVFFGAYEQSKLLLIKVI